ncbi:MAG: CHAT domain-containing protein [Pseudomonadota bacterium]
MSFVNLLTGASMNPSITNVLKICIAILSVAGGLSGCAVNGAVPGHRISREGEILKESVLSARLCEARAYLSLGRLGKAEGLLLESLQTADAPNDLAAIHGSLGQIYHQSGKTDLGRQHIEAGLTVLDPGKNAGLWAELLNSSANLYFSENDIEKAIALYTEALKPADASGDTMRAVRIRINAARAEWARGNESETLDLLKASLNMLPDISDRHEKAYGYLAAGCLLQQIQSRHADRSHDEGIQTAFESGRKVAERIQDSTALSYALGYMAALRQEQGRNAEALALFRQAAFAAQRQGALGSLYRWQWQAGRLLRDEGKLDAAISAYRLAVSSLQEIRSQLALGCKRGSCMSFKETVQPVYFELADLLLQRSAKIEDADPVQSDLREARSTMERLKAAELEDYFQDDCVTALGSGSMEMDRLDSKTTAVYPILLADRVELIVSFPDAGLRQFTVPVKQGQIETTVIDFRRKIQDPSSRPLRQAKMLYDWLVLPYDAALREKGISTLIFIPDGILRTIPLSALHDGHAFVAERYAIVTSPGLSLTDPHPLMRTAPRLLLSGISQSVQGFSPLPNVSLELDQLQGMYKSNVLKDEKFRVGQLEMDLQQSPYPIVHIASHGQFDSNSLKSFILAYDDKIGMDRLEKIMGVSHFRKEPVELLTLSACETALGDDRAALGLAGIALKAGTRSALASLWFVDDRATTQLIVAFYRQLRKTEVNKAEALQSAQLELINNADTHHPAFWAPFLLIGNWL